MSVGGNIVLFMEQANILTLLLNGISDYNN